MHIEIERTIPQVAPERALAWWRDFQEGHVDHRFVVGDSRRIVSVSGDRTMMEDRVRVGPITLFRERTTARTAASAVKFEGVNNLARFEGAYDFAPAGDGTRITLRTDVKLRGALRLTDMAARPIVRAILVADLKHHAADMARDLA